MGKERDQVNPEQLRRSLLRLARLIRKLDQEGRLLESTPDLIRQMGNLRSKLFDYEVRHTRRLLPQPADPPEVMEAQRIIEEAARALEEAEQRWGRPWSPEGEDDDEA